MLMKVMILALALAAPQAPATSAPPSPTAMELLTGADIDCAPEDRICLLGWTSLFDGAVTELLGSPDCAGADGNPRRCRGEARETFNRLSARRGGLVRQVARAPAPIEMDRAFRRGLPRADDPRVRAYMEKAIADLEKPCQAPEPVCLSGTLALWIEADQMARLSNCMDARDDERPTCEAAGIANMMWIDELTTRWAEQRLADHGWPAASRYGAGASSDFWLLVQHADQKPDFQRAAIEVMREAVANGDAAGRDLAYLEDRVAGKDERPQIYGTQGTCEAEGGWAPFPIDDPENVDVRRAAVGLPPLVEYVAVFTDLGICPAPSSN